MSASVPPHPRHSPWWTPWGLAIRLPRVIRRPSDIPWLIRIGWFVLRLPAEVGRMHLTEFLEQTAALPRPRASGESNSDLAAAVERIIRLRDPWLKLPLLRRRNTCYVRALALLRFLDAGGRDVRFNIAAEWHDKTGGVLRGHAWVTVDAEIVDGPPEVDSHDGLQPITIDIANETERRTQKWT